MIDMELEKQSTLTAKDINDLLAFAIGESENDGFVNRYVFERAMYTYLYLLLAEGDEQEKVRNSINENGVLVVWQELVGTGKIEQMAQDHQTEIALAERAGADVFDDYNGYSRSIRASFANIQSASNSIMENAAKQMSQMLSSDQYKDIMDIAEKWGMNNTLLPA
jgi:hypothetical protein|nr:MAG TPA_asm: hypothetical protein [Caudoviricetes sp.]